MDPMLRYVVPPTGQTRSEIIRVPDRMVGLIIGKGGEQIANIQAMSECRIQFASDSYGLSERECTLSGSTESILKAKELITQLMCKGHDLPMDVQSTSQTIEVMIPGNKAGVIIGKGGETIRQLQEQTGVKMVIIQENNVPTNYDKPLRITGDKNSCQKAKEKVLELLADKDGQQQFGIYADYAACNQRTSIDIPVNRSVIGIVIGKGGEMIKKIQQESGARIQFRPDDESSGSNRLCNITGNSEQMQTAIGLIQEIVERQGVNNWSNKVGPPQPEVGKLPEETTYSVPAHKCGLVIGKGGETIREICRASGARVELLRDPVTSAAPERTFKLQGTWDQMQAAVKLISEKVAPNGSSSALPRDGNPAMCGQHASVQDQVLQQILHQQQQQQQQPQNFMSPVQTWQTSFQTAYAQTSPNMPPSVDQMKQQAELQNQQWAAFFFSQQHQQLVPQQPSQFLPRAALPSPAGINPQTGQPDYSLQWADYYRQQGLHQQAQAILQAAAATSHITQ